jgi:parallel beta-helix repeat protein
MGYINTTTRENLSYNAISVKGDSAVVAFNTIDTVGHVGIAGFYSNNKIINNNINYHNFITDDGGGINFFDITFGLVTEKGIDIVSNTVSNAIGAAPGTADNDTVANGIYIDDKINGVRIDSNSVFNIANIGIYFHNVTNISARKNTISDCKFAAFGIAHDKHAKGIPISNLIFTGNTISQPSGYNIYMYNFIDGGNLDSMFTRLDSNIYYKNSSTDKRFRTIIYNGKAWFNQYLNFTSWKSAYENANNGGWDANSSIHTGLPVKKSFLKGRH